MGSPGTDAASATVVVAQKVRAGAEDAYRVWQAEINAAASEFDGFDGAEMIAPTPGFQDDFVVVYRFDTAQHLHAWLGSDRRAEMIERAAGLFSEEPVLHHVATPRARRTVTVVVSHRVRAGKDAAYRAWQKGIDGASSRFPGFVSTEAFEPCEGQPDWVVVFRFQNAEYLQAWLDSPVRAEWIARAKPLIESHRLHKVHGGLGGWFELDEHGGKPQVAPAWKQAMTVLLALYPTLMVLLLVLSPHLQEFPVAVRMLISNVASIAILTWLLMPAATRVLRPWLAPNATSRTTAAVTLVLASAYAMMTVGFWLVTR